MAGVIDVPTVHVPRIRAIDGIVEALQGVSTASRERLLGMAQSLLEGGDFLPDMQTTSHGVIPPLQPSDFMRAVNPNVPDFSKPKKRTYYNYVIGVYKDTLEEHYAAHPGLVFRVGKYDPSKVAAGAPDSWQEESRMGIKHLQLLGMDMRMLLSGVLINDPKEGLLVSPISGTWARKKDAILRKLRNTFQRVTEETDTLLDLLNVLVTRAVIVELANTGGKRGPRKPLELETMNGTRFVSRVVSGRFPVHKHHAGKECVASYLMAMDDRSGMDARCVKDIPSLLL
jgi:hypothetical protein